VNDKARISGGCLCGSIRYEAPAQSPFVSNCHCSQCRRAASAPFQTWMQAPENEVAIEGRLSEYASSDHGTRSFCGACGTQIGFVGTDEPGVIYLTVASLDDPGAVPPTMNVHVADGLAWIHIDDELERHTRLPEEHS